MVNAKIGAEYIMHNKMKILIDSLQVTLQVAYNNIWLHVYPLFHAVEQLKKSRAGRNVQAPLTVFE